MSSHSQPRSPRSPYSPRQPPSARSAGSPRSPGRDPAMSSIGGMLGASGSGDGGTIPSPFTEAEDISPFSGDTLLGDLLTVLSTCSGNISAFINRQSTTDGEGQGDDQYDEYDEDPRRFDDATVRLFAAELMRLLQAITELFVRAQDSHLGQSEREMAYLSAMHGFSDVNCSFWPMLDNTSEQNPILADRLISAQSQIRSETGDCIGNVYQDITARVRALRLLLRDLGA